MSINLGIVDQLLGKVAQTLGPSLAPDEQRRKSQAFVLLVAKTVLDLDDDEALEGLVDGANDAGIDAIYAGEIQNNEFPVTIVQAKYQKRQDGESNFPASEVGKVIQTLNALFDPNAEVTMNSKLEIRVEEILSLIRDGNIPRVRVVLANNGKKWNDVAEQLIRQANFGDQVAFEHVNHDTLIALVQRPQKVSDQLSFSGKAVVEDFNFRRVLIGKVCVTELAELFGRHGNILLERNVRRFLGLQGNRVNSEIRGTLLDANQRANFYFYNNGITVTCSQLRYNALQQGNFQVKVDDLQIINGGQTCQTIARTVREFPNEDYSTAFVLVRLYELDSAGDELVRQITYATNSQNPVDLRDLRANDAIQKRLELSIAELGYVYRRKRETSAQDSQTIPATVAAEAVFSVWRRKPHAAKFRQSELFGKYYAEIFTDKLNGAQVVLAVLLYRFADSLRKRDDVQEKFRFAAYAANFLAMEMGWLLLKSLGLRLEQVDHKSFELAAAELERNRSSLFAKACERIAAGIDMLGFSAEKASLHRLAATFRRADLLEVLLGDDLEPWMEVSAAIEARQLELRNPEDHGGEQ